MADILFQDEKSVSLMFMTEEPLPVRLQFG